jgi:DNA-binding CsgD family transcriptional regulator
VTLEERHFREWSVGKSPQPIPYRWEGGAGAGDFLLVPFPMPGEAGVFALVLIPSEALDDAQGKAEGRAARRAPKWYVPIAAQTEARAEAAGIRELDARRQPDQGLSHLTTREWEIARRIASGDRVSLLAEDLRISPNTVRNHLKAIFRKLGVNSQPQLVRTVRALTQPRVANGE